jgi:cobalt-zinc-cadmium efflux system protein
MPHDHSHSDFDHHHDHDHHPGHGHSHGLPSGDMGRAFLIGIVLNSAFVVIEAFYGFFTHSLSLLADAGHNLGDVLGLGLAMGAAYLSKKKVSDRYSYGLKSSSIVAALVNSSILMVAIGAIILEAVQRFMSPHAVEAPTVMVVAAIGILINGFTAYLFSSGREGDLNVRAAFVHMVGDALISLGVVISAFLYLKTGWVWIDPLVSIGISVAIFVSTLGVLKEALNLALHGVPSHIDLNTVRAFLLEEAGVTAIHDLHVWAMSTTEVALSCHLTTQNAELFMAQGRLQRLSDEIEGRFGIVHSTIQVDHESDVPHCVSDHDS